MSNITTSAIPNTLSIPNALPKFLETAWADYFDYMQNDLLAVGLLFLVFHELVYFGRSLPWFLLDYFGLFKQYKIQQDKPMSKSEYWTCLKDVMMAHIFIESVPIFAFQPICDFFGISYGVPFTPLHKMAMQLALFFVMEDTWHYFGHRLLHHPAVYKRFHKQHHKYQAPFGLTAEYAHPVEVAFTGTGTVGSPILYAYLAGPGQLHLLTVMIWVMARLFQAIDAHSGYDFPWSLRKFLPFWAGADHHDDHHKYFTGNYASSFRWWDLLLGTETASTARRAGRTRYVNSHKKKNQ